MVHLRYIFLQFWCSFCLLWLILMKKQVGGSVLPASVISLYCMYLCYSGLASEPRDYECNGLHKHSKAVSTGTLALGLLTTVLSVVYSAVRAGSSTTLLSPPSSPRAGESQLIYFTIFIILWILPFWNTQYYAMVMLYVICVDFNCINGVSNSPLGSRWSMKLADIERWTLEGFIFKLKLWRFLPVMS